MNLTEAFKALNALNEDTFSVSDDGIKKLSEFEQNDDLTDEISIIDTDAETEDDLQDSYVGKVILDCCVCHSKLYKDKKDVALDDEQQVANVGEECPYCYTSDGFKIIGEVTEFDESENEESSDDDDDGDEDKKLSEAVATLDKPMSGIKGTLGNVMTAHSNELSKVTDRTSALSFLDMIEPEVKNKNYLQSVKSKISKLPNSRVLSYLYNIILKDDGMGNNLSEDISNNNEYYVGDSESGRVYKGIDHAISAVKTLLQTNQPVVIELLTNNKNESLNNVNVETDNNIVNISTEENGKVTVTTETKPEPFNNKAQVISPISDETKSDIEANVDDNEEVEVDIDEFDEDSFDNLGESYLKKIYENVKSYRSTSIKGKDNKLQVEGIITFDTGRTKKTTFLFESKDCTKSGKLRFIGENVEITNGSKAFTIIGKLNERKFITESFNYNYKSKDSNGKLTRIYGTLKNKGRGNK